jgi:hypothetical protein
MEVYYFKVFTPVYVLNTEVVGWYLKIHCPKLKIYARNLQRTITLKNY